MSNALARRALLNVPSPNPERASYARFIPREELGDFASWKPGSFGFEPAAPSGRRRYAYACMDWSERRDHLAGQLADEWLAHCLARGWLERGEGRALALTPSGQRALQPALT